jgi:hypothetical protein
MVATVTSDFDKAVADLEEWGYCLVEGVLSPERVATVRQRLVELAEAEVAAGTDYVYENGSNQRIWTLLNKGDEFIELAMDPTVHRLMARMLDPEFLLSNIDANVAGPGGNPMFLHADQSFVPPPWPPFPLVANAMWMLDDFTEDNGATRVVPGSHLLGHGPDYGNLPDTVPVTGPAGTVMVFDGRLWHRPVPTPPRASAATASSPTTAAHSCGSRRTGSSPSILRCSNGVARSCATSSATTCISRSGWWTECRGLACVSKPGGYTLPEYARRKHPGAAVKKGRHRRFEEARALKRSNEPIVEPCPECGAFPGDEHKSWCEATQDEELADEYEAD